MASTIIPWLLDALLVLTLLLLAWRALASTDLFTAIIVFIGFGLMMALAWLRLRAPDIALAEAAIGAGLTGALLLNAYAKQKRTQGDTPSVASKSEPGRKHFIQLAFLVAGVMLLIPLGWAVLSLPLSGEGLRSNVEQYISSSGVSNPVTAVLLNFRGYDTLLEIAVLLLAMLAIWVVSAHEAPSTHTQPVEFSALWGLTATLTPLLILSAGYVLWIGSSRPGGAFQAGALLGGAAVMLILSGYTLNMKPFWLRLVVALALLVFIATGAALTVQGAFLQYPVEWAGTLILIIETAATVSIGAILALLFLGRRPNDLPANNNRDITHSEKEIS
jgi:multisubunit Na+/H+ antiporter MnhB subunit